MTAMKKSRDELEDYIIALGQDIAEAESDLSFMKARLESLTYELLALDDEEF